MHEDFGNASIEVLFGEVVVSYADDQGPVGYTLHKGDKIQVDSHTDEYRGVDRHEIYNI